MATQIGSRSYPLYNTTFTLHRVSPLYIGNENIDNSTLQKHARRFRDILAGDVLRGVRVGLGSEDDTLARVGALQTVTWKILKTENDWAIDEATELDLNESVMGDSRGIMVEVNYEKAAYTAILLRSVSQQVDADDSTIPRDEDGFLHLPLMLTRMPLSLRETFIQYMSRAFDTRISALKLDGKHLIAAFEKYILDLTLEEPSSSDTHQSTLQKTIKELQISIGFDIPGGSSALKTIDIHIAREDLPRMITRGKKITQDEAPFMAALNIYVKTHLALDLENERVRIVKIACGAFVLGEGRIKLMQPVDDGNGEGGQSRATDGLVKGLISTSKGGILAQNR